LAEPRFALARKELARRFGQRHFFKKSVPALRLKIGVWPWTGKPAILCVDDTLSELEGRQVLLQVLLEENGYEVLTATGGKEAVQLFVSNPVDLVLLDYRMPEINGDTATRRMKAHKPDVPIALLLGDEWPPPSALEAADAFISKSEPIISFLEKVDYLLSLRLLFQPLEILGTDNTGGQSQHKDYRLDRMASSRKARAS